MNRIFAVLAHALLAGCAASPTLDRPATAGSAVALGASVKVGKLLATPVAVIEDSRCPENARCVWAGRLVVSTRLDGSGWRETVPLTLGEPHATHGTTITLVSGVPEKQANAETPSEAYRFAFEGGS